MKNISQRAVVINENILGVISPRDNETIQVLRASIIRGANPDVYSLNINNCDKIRNATKEDFQNFVVVSHPSYFEKILKKYLTK